MTPQRTLILGAAGRDFHNFNVYFRDHPGYHVVAFTAAQIPNIQGRVYPPALAGPRYPDGVPIHPESDLARVVRELRVEVVVLAYSDLAHVEVMHTASAALALGCDFLLLGPNHTQLCSAKPVVAVCAVRTGAGKSPTTRAVLRSLRGRGLRAVPVRHPMPYGDLAAQAVQRFADVADLDRHRCTVEEREEYEPLLESGGVVYAGVDYAAILRQAECEADVLVWDGGNNDLPFVRPDLLIVVADPHRPGHERLYHPGEACARMADVLVINKVDTARTEDVAAVRDNLHGLNPMATVIEAASPVRLAEPNAVRGRRVVVVEDGPTLTHGGMPFGAGWLAARHGGATVVDPRPFAVGALRDTFAQFPHIGPVLPAMGYGPDQVRDLEATLNAAAADAVVVGTPIDLTRFLRLNKPAHRARYELQELGHPTLDDILRERFAAPAPTPEEVTPWPQSAPDEPRSRRRPSR